jgi:predicted enzyme related to lactoylglutathione lyase
MAAQNLTATKAFFSEAFGWGFEDFGPEYSAFSGEGLDGGFYKVDSFTLQAQAPLVVFYSADLESTLNKVVGAGGTVSKPIFTFPGGQRFHFIEPSGNELAVWSELAR